MMASLTVSRCARCNACVDVATEGMGRKTFRYGSCGHVMCLGCMQGLGIDTKTLGGVSTTLENEGESQSDKSRAVPNERRIPVNADCPVCQKHALLFPCSGEVQRFPPYLKKFSTVKKAMENHIPKLCDNCTELAATPTSHCLDCEKFLCRQCYDSHGTGKEFKHRIFKLEDLKRGSLFKALDMKLVSMKDSTLCQQHVGTTLNAWCYKCNKPLCLKCKRKHLEHKMVPFEEHLKIVEDEIKDGRSAEAAQLEQLKDAETTHKFKRLSLEGLSKHVKSAIAEVAEKRKRAIDEDAAKLVQEVDRSMDEFNGISRMLTEMTECEKLSFDVWKRIYNAMSDTESGDVGDDYLLDFYEFLQTNESVVNDRGEIVKQIAEGVDMMQQMHIEFRENEEVLPGNSVGSIGHQVTPDGSQHDGSQQTSDSEDTTASSRPASGCSFDDLDQTIFDIDEMELWKSQQIDRGPFATVFKGVYKTHDVNQPVAIKELDSDVSKQELDGFVNEIHKMRDLDHNNILKLIGACRSNTLLLVTELCPLGSVGKYLKSHPSTPSIDLYELLHQTASGMKYLESCHILHRCLTARTVYLVAQRHVKIGAFAMSKYLDSEEDYFVEKSIRRFPLKWYPPEAIYRFKFDAKSDVWSYGVVMWEVFNYGAKPYQNMKGPEILTMLDIGERLHRPDRCPRPIYDVMKRCWAARRDERPTFASLEQEMREILQKELGLDEHEEQRPEQRHLMEDHHQ